MDQSTTVGHDRLMNMTSVDPAGVPAPSHAYSNGALVAGANRLLFISGQVPETTDGTVPDTFVEQCRLAWRNVVSVLEGAGMTVDNLVKVTVFLSDRRYREENAQVRAEVLGDQRPALTVIITGIWDEAWLLEIEATAAD
jgi:enamine deaminase RidA (YjgF/YER057c/UK114 family)